MEEDNFEKGKKAEKIVEQMFKEAGFKVKKSGYENTFRDLADKFNLIQGPAAKFIRHYPDFIVIDKFNNAHLIEVKYRRFGEINQKDMFNFPETQVILLTKDSMHCQSLKEIYRNGKKFLPLDYLKPFSDIPLGIRNKYIKKTKRLLGDENLIGQLIEWVAEKVVGKKFHQPYTKGEIRFTYIENFNNEGDSYERIGNKEIITNRGGNSQYSHHEKQWNNNEIRTLLNLYRSRKSINEIASILHRRRKAVIFRLVRERVLSMRHATDLIRGKNWNGGKRPKGNRYNDGKRRHHHRRIHKR